LEERHPLDSVFETRNLKSNKLNESISCDIPLKKHIRTSFNENIDVLRESKVKEGFQAR